MMKKANTHVRTPLFFTKVIMRVATAFSIAYQVALVQGSMAPENASDSVGTVTNVEQEGDKWKVSVSYWGPLKRAEFTFMSSIERHPNEKLELSEIDRFFATEGIYYKDSNGDLLLDCGTSKEGVSAKFAISILDHEPEEPSDAQEKRRELCESFQEWTTGLDALNP